MICNGGIMKYCCLLVIFVLTMFSVPATGQSLEEMVENMNTDEQPLVQQPVEPEETADEPDANQPADNVSAMRQRIVELAGSKVGTVVERKGEDGCRVGWENLKQFYEAAYRLEDIQKDRPGWLSTLQTVGKKINDWCGIFGTWAWNRAGLPVYWNTRLIGCKYRGDKANMGVGDMVILRKEVNKYNHHCLIKSIDGNSMVTIDGNQGADSIKIQNRKVSDVEIYYSVADAMGAAPLPTPAKPGSGTVKPAPGAGTSTPPSTTTPSQPGNGQGTKPPTQTQPADDEEMAKLVEQILEQIRIALRPFFW